MNNTNVTLAALSHKLARVGHKHIIVEAMAVRSYKYEGPILKDVHTIAQVIRKSLKDVPGNYRKTYKVRGKQAYEAKISQLGVPADLIKRYSDLTVVIGPGTSKAQGMFIPKQDTISLTYSFAMIDETVIDFRPALRSLDVVIEHELRHYVDFHTGLHRDAMMQNSGNEDSSYTGYYSQELEVDARLTALFLKINRLFRGSALLALNNKIDSMTKEHRTMLTSFDKFWTWLVVYDRKMASGASMDARFLSTEALMESKGKSEEFWKFLREEYGMAFRLVKASEVTPAQKKAWTELHKELGKKQPDAKDVAKITKIATSSVANNIKAKA